MAFLFWVELSSPGTSMRSKWHVTPCYGGCRLETFISLNTFVIIWYWYLLILLGCTLYWGMTQLTDFSVFLWSRDTQLIIDGGLTVWLMTVSTIAHFTYNCNFSGFIIGGIEDKIQVSITQNNYCTHFMLIPNIIFLTQMGDIILWLSEYDLY